ncbi:caspase-8-like [Heterodontus francisci]|uniref:caspase-8-like n=1 Tax=Heterodontus francisci TaxID=7792 RepID=UPI00355B1F23
MATNLDNTSALLMISKELDEEEVRDLRFLCADHFPAGKTIDTALKIFTELQQLDLDIIPELLYQIQRYKLLPILGKQKADVEQFLRQQGNSKISNYRVLLYNLSKMIDDEEVKSITFILKIPKNKLQDIKNFMDICTDLEKREQLAPDNLQVLLEAMTQIKRLDLKSKLENYQKKTQVSLPQQESRKQPKDPNQETFPEISRSAHADAMSIVSAGTESHQDLQQAPSAADHPAVERPHIQQAGGSTTEQSSHAMANLHRAMTAMSMEPTQETSTASSLDAVAALPPCSLAQTSSHSEENQRNSQGIGVYKMDSEPLGICLILNNRSFPGTKFKERNGTDRDAEKLSQVFAMLGFEIDKHDNLTVERMNEILQKYQKFNHETNDCFVCCILSHGERDAIVGTDGKLLRIRNIRSMFSGSHCHSLLEKPKVFFIQACQGKCLQTPCPVMDCATSNNSDLESDAILRSIPEDRDFLFAMSTVPDCVSYRTGEGSWFIQTLCTCLEEYCCQKYDLLTILTEVNRRVSEKHPILKQIPEPRFTLSKKLIISPLASRR